MRERVIFRSGEQEGRIIKIVRKRVIFRVENERVGEKNRERVVFRSGE